MTQARILVAEDELLVAEIIRAKLAGLGYEVPAVVASGEQVVELAREFRPDLVLMDIQLAGEMDGVEAAGQIRTDLGIPVVYLTAYADEATLERAKISGPFGYVLKPFGTADLHSTIQMALYKHEMERRLRESEERYRTLFDQAEDALILENEQEEILDANQAASRLFGYSREELLTMRTPALESGEARVRPPLSIYSSTVTEGERFDTIALDRSGKPIPVEVTITPLRGGKQDLFLSNVRDLTARKQAEEALNRYAERLKILHEIDQSILAAQLPETIAVAAIRRIGHLVPCQRAVVTAIEDTGQVQMLATESEGEIDSPVDIGVYAELFAQRVLGRGWVQGAEDLAQVAHQSPLQAALFKEGIRSYVAVPIHIEGDLVGVLSLESNRARSFAPDDVDIATEVAASLAVAFRQARLYQQARHEIAERKLMEEQLRQQRDLLENAIGSLSHPFYVLNVEDYAVEMANPAAESMGTESESAACYALTHQRREPCFGGEHPCPLKQVIQTKEPVTLEHIHFNAQGEASYVEFHGHPILDSAGNVAKMIEYCFDITERKQTEQLMQVTAATAERERLARELHDAVTQTLFSATLIAEALPDVWDRHPEEGQRGLEELRNLTRGALAELRAMLLELRPSALVERPLGDLLQHLTRAMAGRIQVPINLEVEGECMLPPRVQVALYRITQEALNNIAKHANAGQVSVGLNCIPGRACLHIEDDGSGFDPDGILPDRMGLGIMRERAEGVGAVCEVSSRPGQGTRVAVDWRQSGGRAI